MSGAKPLNLFQRMIRVTGTERECFALIVAVIAGFNIGCIIDRSDTESMVIYRDRSSLYRGLKKESDPPSWPSRETWWT